MSITPKILFAVPITDTTRDPEDSQIKVVPVNKAYEIKRLDLCNKHTTTARSVDLIVGVNGAYTAILSAHAIPALSTLTLSGLCLSSVAGHECTVHASITTGTAGDVELTASGLEIDL